MQNPNDLIRRIELLEAAINYMVQPALQMENTEETGATAKTIGQIVAGGQAPISLHQTYGHYSRPLPNAIHIQVSLGGSNARGISIASSDERYRPRNLAPGDVTIQDSSGQYVWLSSGNTLNIVTNATVNITAPTVNVNASTKVMVTSPTVEMSGNLLVHGDISDKNGTHGTVADFRATFNVHTHSGVTPGGGSSFVPNSQQ